MAHLALRSGMLSDHPKVDRCEPRKSSRCYRIACSEVDRSGKRSKRKRLRLLRRPGIRPAFRSHGDEIALRQKRAEIPTDDLRDLTGILLGDPWPNDYRRSRERDGA